jgi:hypothetical protein
MSTAPSSLARVTVPVLVLRPGIAPVQERFYRILVALERRGQSGARSDPARRAATARKAAPSAC